MKTRNVILGIKQGDAFYIGDTAIPSIYLGDTLIFGGDDDQTMTAADCGLTTSASIMYVDGECFGDPLKEVINVSGGGFFAWGGYKFPQQWNNNGLTVIHYDAYPPAIYIPNYQTVVYHYGTVVPGGFYFVLDETKLLRAKDSYSGQGLSIHKSDDTAYENGALFVGPDIKLRDDPSGGYRFSSIGAPASSYIRQGETVEISVDNTSAHMMLAGLLSANAGRRLTFEDSDN